jgi:IclR family KDG regulon transcriptional repressor
LNENKSRTPHRLFSILEILAYYSKGLTLTELMTKLNGAPKSSTYNLLQQMIKNGYVYCDNNNSKRYRIGSSMIRLSSAIMYHNTIQRQARPYLKQLSEETGEDVYLGIRDNDRLIYIDKVEGNESIRLDISIGTPRYLHNSSIGKLFLAYMKEDEQRDFIKENGLTVTARNTITGEKVFVNELKKIHQQGFSVTNEESIDGVYGTAAPVKDESGEIVAGVTLSLPIHRTKGRTEFLKESIVKTGKQISQIIN